VDKAFERATAMGSPAVVLLGDEGTIEVKWLGAGGGDRRQAEEAALVRELREYYPSTSSFQNDGRGVAKPADAADTPSEA
jgi:hypothetical protein